LKKLLTFGCSYTDDKYIELTSKYPQLIDLLKDNDGNMTKSFPYWPELLSKKLNMKYENYAQCGFGNDGIHATFLENIVGRDDIGMVIIMWSEFMRLDMETTQKTVFGQKFEWFKNNIAATTAGGKNADNNKSLRHKQIDVANILGKYNLIHPIAMLRKSIRHFYEAQQICDSKNINLFQIMGMPPSRKKNEIESSKHIINNPVADEINTDTFIGWPMMTQIGGFSCGSQLYDIDPKREKYFINYDNVHPNALGQEFISELLFEKVKEHGSI
jgi:hypothetical protein